ncbi:MULTISPECIES: AraC family transcriptional regulator [Alteromonadales]|jgi:AraC-like DNA-binding protein|uniref:AraC family transcriptional regulator n=3 Tax=Alteromonadaceae TaxID=72275 RepID=A0AAC9ADI5_9ALTE|nr:MULTISPECIES: AraC family transcriptional regulator [Alteromonadaceae]MCG8497877.1 AraC family transcriptional regulator [Enterobacterales bacterium]MCP3861728.1 AraC family transcriptional regulator [Aestuariibacter sp.]MEC9062453.1 AraC family transcriptional regulator [Pseudomonadota bacterium]AFV85943.1 AraC family transcriptional regulator [Alteromonas mediterranea DE1]AGP82273.1 AraC family transcriptional regulator [Alteromonas mediterranea MED64]|tara:strand:- start:488 stop:1501 length:1014 start_codon:yes stop_codon:yes gene_type:complete
MSLHYSHSVSVHFANAVLDAARQLGLNLEPILQSARLNQPLLDNPQSRITSQQFSQLMRSVWEQSDDEFLGLTTQPSKYGVFRLFADGAIQEQNLHRVYKHLCRFYSLVNQSISLSLYISKGQVELRMRQVQPEIDRNLLFRDFFLLLWHRFPGWLIGKSIPLQQVKMRGAEPAHAAEYRFMFPCPITYGHDYDAFVFSEEELVNPVTQRAENLREHFKQAPLNWFTRQEFTPVYTRRVMDYLAEYREHEASMQDIADSVNVSERTLRRKLTEEGTSFQEIKDKLRKNMAIYYLSQPDIPISTITNKLGFSEPAAFTRAFKQWTGQTPTLYRENTLI